MRAGINIIFEDQEILVLDKPSGLTVNRSETIKVGTLQDELSEYFRLGGSLGIGNRAGIVHRLDRETSGVIVIAKTEKSFENLQEQFKSRQVEKKYAAIVHGDISEDTGSITGKIVRVGKFGKFGIAASRQTFTKVGGGKEARTDFMVRERFHIGEVMFAKFLNRGQFNKQRINYLKKHAKNYCLLDVFPKTGRTHQIRIHLKSRGNPVVSDLIYAPSKLLKFDLLWCPRLFLHATFISFAHPKTHKKVSFDSDLPKDLKNAILNLETSN
jgi:23S rRNA pseudouridine1911/1915/1917 synthase